MADAAKKIMIGCKLPSGLVLDYPNKPNKEGHLVDSDRKDRVSLRGVKHSKIVGSPYGLTQVDAEFWAAWKKANPKFPALLNGTIFEAANAEEAEVVAKDYAKEKTGFERMQTDGKDPRAMGVKKVTENDNDDE